MRSRCAHIIRARTLLASICADVAPHWVPNAPGRLRVTGARVCSSAAGCSRACIARRSCFPSLRTVVECQKNAASNASANLNGRHRAAAPGRSCSTCAPLLARWRHVLRGAALAARKELRAGHTAAACLVSRVGAVASPAAKMGMWDYFLDWLRRCAPALRATGRAPAAAAASGVLV